MNGVSYNEAWGMSPLQRKNIIEFLTEMRKREQALISGKQHM